MMAVVGVGYAAFQIWRVWPQLKALRLARDAKVIFDGERILVDGFEPDRNPVIQAKAQATWLREVLAESTGRKFPVRPVVLFPGWFVEQGKGTTREIWVLTLKALPSFLAREPALP